MGYPFLLCTTTNIFNHFISQVPSLTEVTKSVNLPDGSARTVTVAAAVGGSTTGTGGARSTASCAGTTTTATGSTKGSFAKITSWTFNRA
jgi:hypothetical protein